METEPTQAFIRIRGARQHNLRNLDIDIPRNRLVVLTGLSGSGKSSLAFDTLYAEGQRKYVESLSSYARQYLEKMPKPDVDYIEGLSPAIAIEQRSSGSSPRSIIATATEIYDYLRILYAAVGQPHDPATGEPVKRQTPQEIADVVLSWTEGTRVILLAPLAFGEKQGLPEVLALARKEGFVRLRIDGEVVESDAPLSSFPTKKPKKIEAVIDRIVIRPDIERRLADSVDLALRWGENRVFALRSSPGQAEELVCFSTDYRNPNTGFSMPRLTPKHFSFNSHLGACPRCHGLGTISFCDPERMVNSDLSLRDGAILPWKSLNKKMRAYYESLQETLAAALSVDAGAPFGGLPRAAQEAFLYGSGETLLENLGARGKREKRPFEGIVPMVERMLESSESELTRQRLRAFTGTRLCPSCEGRRLKPEILAVTIPSKSGKSFGINDFCSATIADAAGVCEALLLPGQMEKAVSDISHEISKRLWFLREVGLGYLTLNRESNSLSGGESQRIRLASQLGSSLSGVLYVLDEPSIGLHQRDNDRLIATLKKLRDIGNSVIVVEHDEDTIRSAEFVLDFGPGAGTDGGQLVAWGTPSEIEKNPASLTGQFLSRKRSIPLPSKRVSPRSPKPEPGEERDGWISVFGASENNLKNIDASFPLGCMTCLTGVSGSGKSTLLNDILRPAAFRELHSSKEKPGKHLRVAGLHQIDKAVVIDQSPIGRSPRSNPATYSGALDPIRTLFSEVPAARVRGYGAGRFSFNVKGGRCEHCQGDGQIRVEMHFLADAYVECEACRGLRYNRETLDILYKGKSIAEVLAMTASEALSFFCNHPAIAPKLQTLVDVGLGYLQLGQAADTLSGGEAQRVKLASELSKKSTGKTLYLLDEPTTGLHFADIEKLLEVLMRLRDAGNSLIVIEHNLDVIKCADWLLDLGPEGGSGGGRIVAEGSPELVATNTESHTARYLKPILFR